MRDEIRRSVKSSAVPFVFSMLRRPAPGEWPPPPVSVPLRHLHGHCVVCYTVERWLVFVAVISAGSERTSLLNRVSAVFK